MLALNVTQAYFYFQTFVFVLVNDDDGGGTHLIVVKHVSFNPVCMISSITLLS